MTTEPLTVTQARIAPERSERSERFVFEIEPRNRFLLDQDFLEKFRGCQPRWGFDGLGYVVFKRTYARTLEDGSSEEYWQTMARVVEGAFSVLAQHLRQTGKAWDPVRAQRKAQEMFRRAWQFKWLPPGRSLWFMGTRALETKGGAALFNCAMKSTQELAEDFAGPFCVTMDLLMLGVGVGFDVRGSGRAVVARPRVDNSFVHVVADNREGWVEALRATIAPYGGRGALPSRYDVSRVRPLGSPLRTFGGTASGPEPLCEMLDTVRTLLDAHVGRTVDAPLIVDLMNVIGRCVVAGNIRRSSELSLGSPTDESFLTLKDPKRAGAKLGAWRWASNNSVIVDHHTDFGPLAAQTVLNGEPGYFWLDTARAYGRTSDRPTWEDSQVVGCNPCGEISLEDAELCNLAECFPAAHDDLCDFRRTLKCAYLYAKIVTLVPIHHEPTQRVVARNRRIGTGLAGVFGWYQKVGRREAVRWMDEGYRMLRELDSEYSEWMGIPRSKKRTTVKPGGSTPLLAGHEGGMRVPQSLFYYRTIRMPNGSPIAEACARAGYRVEQDLVTPRTVVVYFPVSHQGCGRSAREVSLWERAAIFTDLQRFWSDNQVSATLMFQEHEAGDVQRVLEHYADQWKAVSFLPFTDHGYAQAPYQPITEQEYRAAVACLKPLRLDTASHEETDAYCSGGLCSLPPPKG